MLSVRLTRGRVSCQVCGKRVKDHADAFVLRDRGEGRTYYRYRCEGRLLVGVIGISGVLPGA